MKDSSKTEAAERNVRPLVPERLPVDLEAAALTRWGQQKRDIRHLKSDSFPLLSSSFITIATTHTQAKPHRSQLATLSYPRHANLLLLPSRKSWPKACLRLSDQLVPTGKITSTTYSHPNSPQQPPSDFLTEHLNFGPAPCNRPSFHTTATIYSNPLYTTASQSTSWLPHSSNTGQPASQSPPQQQPSSQSDFVLYPARRSFEAAPSAPGAPSLPDSQAFGGAYRRHSSHQSSAQALQNQRVVAIIKGTGHSTTSTEFTNRFTPAQAPFYASSAPSSSVALQAQSSRPRPKVPAFSQSTGNIPHKQSFQPTTMNQDMDLYDNYTSYQMEGASESSFQAPFQSPAVPTTYDLQMARTNSSSTNVGTVSPQDLMVRDPSFSAPNSTAFTNLTSPSDYDVSPGFNEFDSSPLFHDNLDGPTSEVSWYTLFPDSKDTALVKAHSPADESLDQNEELVVAEQLRQNHGHRRSSSSQSVKKPSTSSGVSARKRNLPLPPIVVEDTSDFVAVKRARNTLAARKSRTKKEEHLKALEDEIADLKKDRDHWKNIALNRRNAPE